MSRYHGTYQEVKGNASILECTSNRIRIIIQISELDNLVEISGRENPLLAGENHTICCTVESDIAPTVNWLDGDGNKISGHEDIIVGEPIVSGNTTLLKLTFAPLRTSHGGVYHCRSEVDHPPSVQQDSRDIFVQRNFNYFILNILMLHMSIVSTLVAVLVVTVTSFIIHNY